MATLLKSGPPEIHEPAASQRAGEVSVAPRYEKLVVVQSGARDAYQLARALSEAGMLEALVTDLFWPVDRPWTRAAARMLPRPLRSMLLQRSDPNLPAAEIDLCAFSGLLTLALDKLPRVPKSWRRVASRSADATLGRTAGKLAKRRHAGLIS